MNDLYEKYKNTKTSQIYEIILQWYLIQKGIRDLALVYLKDFRKKIKLSPAKWRTIRKFLESNNISYHVFNDEEYLVLYNPDKFSIEDLNETGGKNFAKQLGEFYDCASNDFSNNFYRVVINVNNVEIFAQMCKKNMIKKNISKYYEMYLKINDLFNQLNPKDFFFCKLEIYKLPKN